MVGVCRHRLFLCFDVTFSVFVKVGFQIPFSHVVGARVVFSLVSFVWNQNSLFHAKTMSTPKINKVRFAQAQSVLSLYFLFEYAGQGSHID
jgi:hypothetical protein